MRLFLFFLVLVLFSSPGYGRVLDLKGAIRIALKRNPDYRSAALAVKASEEVEREAFAKRLFSLSFSYSYSRLNEEQRVKTRRVVIPPLAPGMSPVEMDPGDIVTSKQNVYKYNFTFFQPLFTGGKLSEAHRIARLGVDVERLKERESKLDLIFRVKKAYYEALKAKRLLEVARQSVKLLESHYRDAKAFYEEGITPKVDLLRAEVALSQAKQNLTVAEARYKIALAALAVLLRDRVDADYTLKDVRGVPVLGLSFRDCLEEALRKRPIILALRKRVEIAKGRVKMERSDYYPHLYLVGEYSKHGDTPDCTGDGLTDAERWSITARLEWKFFEWGATRHRVKRASVEALRVLELERSVEDKVKLEVREAYLMLRAAKERLVVAKKQVEQALLNYRDTRERYRQQIDTTTDVIDAQVFLTRAKNQYYSALYEYNIAYAKLERVMGREN